MKPWTIHHGDVKAVCKKLEETSFDACLCDPPYGLSFMGRRWDYSVPSAMLWAEVERVLKPGAHGMIFGGARTFHRTAVAVEDGGFEIRDVMMWLYGSGFPKSTDVSKGIDASLGYEREVVGFKQSGLDQVTSSRSSSDGLGRDANARSRAVDFTGLGEFPEVGRRVGKQRQINGLLPVTAAASEGAKAWDGYGSALKPAYEPILVVRRFPDGTLAETAMKWETGGLAIDASRIGDEERFIPPAGNTGESPASIAPVNVSTYGGRTAVGRWPANVMLSHDGACVLEGTRVSKETVLQTRSTGKRVSGNRAMSGANYGRSVVGSTHRPPEEVWSCVSDCPVRRLDEQSGNRPGMSGGGKHRPDYPGGMFGGIDSEHTARGDSGGASRFFYTPKADRYQRNAGCEALPSRVAQGVGALRDSGRGSDRANVHPTVKPIDLIRYLARMILPPARKTPRRILVPFSGSGSEMIGCLQAGWDEVIGIEREAEYVEIATARIKNGGVLSGLLEKDMREREPSRRPSGRRVYGKFARDK